MAATMKPAVLVLGMVHTANPGRDLVNKTFDDVLTTHRQREFDACVEKLARFRPTKIAVEWNASEQDLLDAEYQAYQERGHSKNRHEIHQLGFRLASHLKHPGLYGVDRHDPGPDIRDVYHWAEVHQPGLYQELEEHTKVLSTAFLDPHPESSIWGHLRAANEPSRPSHEQEWYLGLFSLIGRGLDYPGVDWMVGWYRRNMTVYVNVTRMISSPEDRILVMFGAGHRYLLEQFFTESGRFVLESAEEYLI